MDNKLISVIIPIYNRAEYLDKCIGSVLEQKDVNTEVILVDDGSTDASAQICDKYATEHDNITAIHNTNHGVAHARNCGLDAARGDYIFFLDSDDSIEPGCLFLMLNLLKNSDADFCVGKLDEYNNDGTLSRAIEFCDYVKDRAVDVKTSLNLCKDMDYPIIDAIAGKLYPSRLLRTFVFLRE